MTRPKRRVHEVRAVSACWSIRAERRTFFGAMRFGLLTPTQSYNSEGEANSQLNLARRSGSVELPQSGIHLVPVRVEARRSVERTELRVIECVVGLRAELQPEWF